MATSKNKVAPKTVSKPVKTKKKHFSSTISDLGFSQLDKGLCTYGRKISDRDFFRLMKMNSDVYSCINKIISTTAMHGLLLKDEDGETVKQEDAKKEYEYLHQLFSMGTFNLWKESVITEAVITGENYIEPIYSLSGKILRSEILSRRNTEKVVQDGSIVGFRNTPQHNKVQNGKSTYFDREELAHFYFRKDVEDYFEGAGLLHPVMFDVLSDYEAGKSSYSFFVNKMTPTAIFMLSDDLDEEEQEEALKQIKKMYTGSENSGRAIANNVIEDVKTLSFSYKDLDFINVRRFNTQKVCSVFSINPEIIGIAESTGSESKLNRIWAEFYNNTIVPYEKYMESILNAFVQKFASDLIVDLSKYEVCVNPMSIIDHEQQRGDLTRGIKSLNQIRVSRGDKPYDDPMYDQPMFEKNLIPAKYLDTLYSGNTPVE